MELISLIVPCYNEENALPLFYEEAVRVAAALPEVNFEFIFVDDGSKDKTVSLCKKFARQDSRVRFLSFSRNFGKEAAMYAGLQASRGDYVVIADADLQHPPRYIIDMYRDIRQEGYDCVAMYRSARKGEPKLRSFFAKVFYKFMRKISTVDIKDGACDFRLMKRKMVDAVLSMSEYTRFSKGIFAWVGFRTKWLPFENVERVAGQTSWSFWSLFKYSITGLTAFSTAPLFFALLAAFVCGIASVATIVVALIVALTSSVAVNGFAVLAAVILFLAAFQFGFIGIMGEYLSKTYLETKKRPIYIIRETDEDQDV